MAITKFLDPKNDFVFKKMFGTEKNKDILIHFLNDILGYEDDKQITEVAFLKPNQDTEISRQRQSIVDVLCRSQNGTQIIVEMQVTKHKGFEKRAQYYAAKTYSQQVLEDEKNRSLDVYATLKEVIFVAIVDFVMFAEEKKWITKHKILEIESQINHLKDFSFIFIELPKFNKKLKELKSFEDKWIYFFKHAKHSEPEEIESLVGEDNIIKRAFDVINMAGWTQEELATYESIVKTMLDNQAIEAQKLFDAEARGEARGIAVGKAEGIAEGETKSKLAIAKNMLSLGIASVDILKATGLTKQEIDDLI